MRGKETAYYKPSILVLVAALNEENGLRLTIDELRKHVSTSHVLVVDGNSSDQTVHVAKTLGADVIYQAGKGKGDHRPQGGDAENKDTQRHASDLCTLQKNTR